GARVLPRMQASRLRDLLRKQVDLVLRLRHWPALLLQPLRQIVMVDLFDSGRPTVLSDPPLKFLRFRHLSLLPLNWSYIAPPIDHRIGRHHRTNLDEMAVENVVLAGL